MTSGHNKLGLPPGEIIFTGRQVKESAVIHNVQYNESMFETNTYDEHATITTALLNENQVNWFDIRGTYNVDLIHHFGAHFKIHPLVLEDISDVEQRPKFEEYEDGLFVLLKALHFDKEKCKVYTEQVGIYFSDVFVISFQERNSDLFALIRKRIEQAKGRIRLRQSDYLAYCLMDLIVDNYFVVLEALERLIEDLEDRLLDSPESSYKNDIHDLKKELLTMRKTVFPLQEAVMRFARIENELVTEKTQIFLRDLQDHATHVMDQVEAFRDLVTGLQDLYLAELSFKMNQVVQLLTLISVIFIPLSFLAGIYGMNFTYIPELQWRYGYFLLLTVMALIVIGLLLLFKKKKWL